MPYKKIVLKIEKFTPLTLPMARLAEYLADFAKLLGEPEAVHFVRVKKGSAGLESIIDEQALPRVVNRIHLVKIGDAPQDALRADNDLNEKLRQDETNATVKLGKAKLLVLRGESPQKAGAYGPVKQQGTIEGMLIKIGGKDETVPVHLQDNERPYICNATREMAKRLAPHLFGATLRVYGTGTWSRTDAGWVLDKFNISDFEFLDDAPLPAVIERLRAIPDNEWDKVEDPLGELQRIRKGESKVQ